MEIKTRLAGIAIPFFGAAFVILGAIFLLTAIVAFARGQTDGSSAKGGAVFLSIGVAAGGYGWRCVKGFGQWEGSGK